MVHLSRPFSFDEYALIIDHIAENRQLHPALKALCLTQRSLVHLCQKHIFSSITCSSQKLDTFPDITRTSPHLFDYIRDFRYELVDSNHRNKNTIALFERLNELRSLSVRVPKSSRGEVNWDIIDHPLSNALLRLILSPNLHSLLLSKIINFPLNGLLGLRNSKHLKTISLTKVELSRELSMNIDILSDSDSSAPQLSTFNAFINSWEAVTALLGIRHLKSALSLDHPQVFDFTRLRKIYAESGGDIDSITYYLLIKSATQLDELGFVLTKNSNATFQGLAEAILNGPFQMLRHLWLSTNEPDGGDVDPFFGSVQQLKHLAGGKMKSLEEIALCFNTFTTNANSGPDVQRICRDIEAECKSIDGIFADREAFPALRSISIDFILRIWAEPGFGDPELEREFNMASQLIAQKSFEYLDAIPSISNSFRLEIFWED